MAQSIFQIKKIEELKKKALILYKQGLTTREVGKAVGKSHQWVAVAVREKLSTV
jgi:hypothetical protein